jgi:NADH-quinone oxidoreductase subunit L
MFKRIEFISDIFGGFAPLQKLLSNKYYVDEFYQLIIVKPVKRIAGFAGDIVDKYVVDGAVNGVGRGVRIIGSTLRIIQTGDLQTYGILMLGGLLLAILFIFKVLV